MNERFLEIAKQAKLKFPSETALSPVEEKFAELIVRECIEQCADNGSNDEWDKDVRWSANQIKEHFGVE